MSPLRGWGEGINGERELMGSVPISNMTINHFIIIKLNPIKSEMGPVPINSK